MSDVDPAERLRILAHELRSPVAALSALVEAAPQVTEPSERRRLVALGIAAGRDVERLLTDPELLSLRRGSRRRRPRSSRASPAPGVDVRAPAGRPSSTETRRASDRCSRTSSRTASGTGRGSRSRWGRATGAVVVAVSDDGPGVEPGLDPFARGASASGSTGYGLWLGRAIAEAHGGSLDYVPDGAPGARFRLALPSAAGGR